MKLLGGVTHFKLRPRWRHADGRFHFAARGACGLDGFD